MTPEDEETLMAQLVEDEGLRLKPYTDTVGKLTIGVGRNLTDKGISRLEAFALLRHDINDVQHEVAEALSWSSRLSPVRQRVLLNMAFNLGTAGLLKFTNTLASIEAGDYESASKRMLQSRWARQVGRRAKRLAKMMATGTDQPLG